MSNIWDEFKKRYPDAILDTDGIVDENIAVPAGWLFVAVPIDKLQRAFMSCFPETLFQPAAEVNGIGEIIVVVNPDRGIVYHRSSPLFT